MLLTETWTQRTPSPRCEMQFDHLKIRLNLLLQRISLLKDAKGIKDLSPILDSQLADLLDDTRPEDVVARMDKKVAAAERLAADLFVQEDVKQSPLYAQWIAWTVDQGRHFAREHWGMLPEAEKQRLDFLLASLSYSPFNPERILRRSRSEISFVADSEWAYAWLEGYFSELQPHCQFSYTANGGVVRVHF